jgi:DNA-binding NarL/FixJ family response regulator
MISASIRVELVCEDLSSAQRIILIHRTLGRDLKTICRLTNYAPDTVKHYLSEAREKLHADNNEQACWLARFFGQITDADILREYTRMQELDREQEATPAHTAQR